MTADLGPGRRMLDIRFYEAFAEEAEELKRILAGRWSYDLTPATIQEAGDTAPPARIISIRTQSVIPSSWAGRIDGVLSRTTGFDHLTEFLARAGRPVPCGYLEEYATRAVAEQAFLLLLALLRKLPSQVSQLRTFDRDGLTGRECAGRKLLVVGVGRIGVQIAEIAHALGMEVQGVDIVRRHTHITYADRDAGLRWAEAVICAMNLTNENAGYFSADLLRRAQPGLLFVNIARGDLAPTGGLLALLQEGHLGGVGLDVFEDEPRVAEALRSASEADSPTGNEMRALVAQPNVICTPHNAFNTRDALARKAASTVDQVEQFLRHGDFRWKV